MNNHQRGVYQPLVENIPIYDLNEDEVEDEERSRLPLFIVFGLIVVAAFTGVVWLAYNQGVERGRGTTIVIAPPEGPPRTQPPDAPASTPYTNFKVYGTDPVASDKAIAGSQLAVQPPSPPTTETPPVRLPVPDSPPAARQAPAPALAPRVAPPAPAPRVAPPAPPPVVAQQSAPAVQAPPPAAVALAPVATPKVAAAGGFVLQLGSYQSPALAEAGWNTFKARYAGVAEGLTQDVQQVDLGTKGTWFRLRAGPFTDKPAAAAACDKLKTQGGTCFVTAP